MHPAAVPVPDVSGAALELAALELLTAKPENELPTVRPPQPKGDAPAADDSAAGAVSDGGRRPRFWWRPFSSPARYFARLQGEFGNSLLLGLMSNYLFLKGAAYHMAIAASTPVFRELLKLQAEQHSMATALFMIPWSVKGIVGSLSDLWALGGYHKRSYMLLASGIGVLGASVLIGAAGHLTMGIAVAGFFMIMVQASFNDLLCEGAYTRRMAEKPHTGAALTSFVWLCSSMGTFLQAVWVGPVVDHLPFQVVLAPFLPLCAQQLFLLLWPWPFRSWSRHSGVIGETYVKPKERFKSALLTQHGRLFICAICLTVCAFGSMVAGLMNDKRHIVGMVYWLCAGLCMTSTVLCTMPRYLAKPVLYMFLGRMFVPTISSQFSYWLRAGPDCVPDGPHFNWTFLLTWNALAQSLFAFVGVALFQRYVSKWTFRRAFLVTSILQQLTCLFDIAMVMRWNRKLGIPDKMWYFCSASIIEEVASMWAFMPGCVLISRLCPKNIESTMYAVVAGLQNFAQSMSKFSGNFLCYTLLGIRTLPTEGSACNFDNLPTAIGLAMGLCPLLPISLTFWLVPNIHMNETISLPDRVAQQQAAAAGSAQSDPSASGANAETATPQESPSPPDSLLERVDSGKLPDAVIQEAEAEPAALEPRRSASGGCLATSWSGWQQDPQLPQAHATVKVTEGVTRASGIEEVGARQQGKAPQGAAAEGQQREAPHEAGTPAAPAGDQEQLQQKQRQQQGEEMEQEGPHQQKHEDQPHEQQQEHQRQQGLQPKDPEEPQGEQQQQLEETQHPQQFETSAQQHQSEQDI